MLWLILASQSDIFLCFGLLEDECYYLQRLTLLSELVPIYCKSGFVKGRRKDFIRMHSCRAILKCLLLRFPSEDHHFFHTKLVKALEWCWFV